MLAEHPSSRKPRPTYRRRSVSLRPRTQINLLPVEVITPKIDPQGNPVDGEFVNAEKLKVAKWEDSFLGTNNNASVKEDFIGWDRDRFYVRIPNGVALGVTSVEIATEDNPDAAYNDDATEIDVVDSGDGKAVITKAMILVSDDDDDDYAANGAGADDQKNDRTHKVQLGGNLVIKSVTINGKKHEMNLKIPVPARAELDLDLYRMNVAGVHSIAKIQENVKIIKERYAQAGLKINANVQQKGWPQAVETEKTANGNNSGVGFFNIFTLDTPPNTQGELNSECKVFIDAIDNVGVNLFFLRSVYPSRAIAIGLKQAFLEPPGFNLRYTDKAFINSGNINLGQGPLGFTPAHELLHLLAHKEHGQDDHAQRFFNLLFAANVQNDPVLWSKRINQDQEEKIHTHTKVRRINP